MGQVGFGGLASVLHTSITYGVWGSTKCENKKYGILTLKIGDRV